MMWVTEEREENSWQRGRQGAKDPKKIRGEEKYLTDTGHLIEMGILEATLRHTAGCLTVDLHRAKNIAGKRSQDSYAQVFLIEDNNNRMWHEEQKVIFEIGHEKTKVFKKNLNPEFNDQFKFKMDDAQLARKSLVVSIWDEDSSSKDDFMAGFTLPLRDLARFNKLGFPIGIKMTYQAMDGYPERLSDKYIEDVFGGFRVITTGWDLKECNNRLVTYIDRARVLKQAYNLKAGLPDQLDNRTSVVVTESSNFLSQQIDKLRMQVTDARKRRALAEQRRQVKREECERNERRYRTQETVLRERQEELDRLAEEEAKLRCRECSSKSLRDYYGQAIEVRARIVHSIPRVNPEKEVTLGDLHISNVSVGRDSKQVEMEAVAVRVRSEFHSKFINNLEEARRKYQKQSHLEISIEEDIMKIYKELISKRVDNKGWRYRLDELRLLERGRDYQPRIQQLLEDIRDLKRRITEMEARGRGMRIEWDREMLAMTAALDAHLDRLREVMSKISIFIQNTEELDEVALYQQLLDFEKSRLSARHVAHTAKVTERSSRSSRSMSTTNTVRGTSFSRSHRDSSVDSGRGYSKAATPDGTLDGGNMRSFEFDSSEFRTSTSGRSSRNSAFLGNLEATL